MGQLIQLLFGEENFSTPPVIEHAHRSMVQQKNQNVGPRPILVKFLCLQDKRKVQRLAREKKELKLDGERIYIYPDYSAGLLLKRRQFDPIKKKLRDLDMDYSLLYLSTLRIIVGGKPMLFDNPEQAESYVRDILSP